MATHLPFPQHLWEESPTPPPPASPPSLLALRRLWSRGSHSGFHSSDLDACQVNISVDSSSRSGFPRQRGPDPQHPPQPRSSRRMLPPRSCLPVHCHDAPCGSNSPVPAPRPPDRAARRPGLCVVESPPPWPRCPVMGAHRAVVPEDAGSPLRVGLGSRFLWGTSVDPPHPALERKWRGAERPGSSFGGIQPRQPMT